nr:EAL domain-containing protein [Actinomycetota bacterium]
GLIGPLTLAVLDQALEQCRSWMDQRLDLCVAVNLARRNLLDPAFPEEVAHLLTKWGVSAHLLDLEITESSIMSDPGRAADCLTKLSAMRITLSLDDFGAGYSSLAHLKRLPVAEIKIDKSFVINMRRDDNDKVIVHSTIDLAHNLGLKVTAEGVESLELWRELSHLRCDVAQGFYMSPPVPPGQLTSWIKERNGVFAISREAAVAAPYPDATRRSSPDEMSVR